MVKLNLKLRGFMGTRIQQALGLGGPFINVFPPPFIALRAPTSSDTSYPLGQVWIDNSVSPAVSYEFVDSANGTWQTGGNAHATTTEFGTVILNDSITMAGATDDQVPTALAIKTYADNLVIAGAPVATEVTAGIGQLATDAEAVAGTASTPALALLVTPSNLTPLFAAPPALGGTTPAAATFTSLTASGGTVTLTSTAASVYDVTGAGNDLTLSSDAGRVIVNGEEAAANAITLLTAAGGIDVDAALQINIATSQNAVDAIRINASAGGIDIDATGAATEDINITNTGGSIVISATENIADSIVINATTGGIDITADGAAASDLDLACTNGSVTISAGEAVADAINIDATAGGIDVDAVGQVNIASSQSAGDAIVITSSAGGIDITAPGAAAGEDIDITAASSINIESTEDAALAIYLHANGGVSETIRLRSDLGTGVNSIDVLSDVGGVTINAGLSSADAINIVASAAGGGIDIDAGTAGVIVDTTGGISLDAAAASNFTATGAFDITVNSTAGSIVVTGGEAAVDAIDINASNAAGGIDVDAGTGGITLDTTGAFSIDGALASNVTTTGAGIDLTLSSVLGSVLVSSTEDTALAIRLYANGGVSETIQIHSDQGTGVGSVNLLSDVGGITIRATGLATADAINLEAPAGGLDVDVALQMNLTSSQNAVDAIRINATAGGIDIDAVGTAGEDINITNTGASIVLNTTEATADAITILATGGGMDITTTGAGLDMDLLATGGSINITATEAASSAIVLNASNAAGGIDITTGGGSVDISSAGFATVVAATVTEASPSATGIINANVGRATFTGFTTGAAGTQTFVITNSVVTTSSCVLVTVCNEGANDAQMNITRITRGAGSLSVATVNSGAAALNGNVAVNFWVLTA